MRPPWTSVPVLLSLGCGQSVVAGPPDGDFSWHPVEGSLCNARVRAAPLLSVEHVAPGTTITWNTNPPSSGPHEGPWARWGFATSVIPRNNWVHNLEHGGVVMVYRCPDATCANAALVRAVAASLPNDPRCALPDGTSRPRVLITPDPLIAREVAAAAWGYVYEADCVEASSLRSFAAERVGRGPENTCAEGFVP